MIDLIEIQRLIYERLSECNYTVADEYTLYNEVRPPYVQLSSIYLEDDDTKNTKGLKIEQYINVYSTYTGKKEILQIVDEVNKLMNDYETTYKESDKTYNIYIESDRHSIMLDVDTNKNKFYHAVMLFIIHIN